MLELSASARVGDGLVERGGHEHHGALVLDVMPDESLRSFLEPSRLVGQRFIEAPRSMVGNGR